MAPAAFLPVEPGDRVLDMCAAPGGKTTELASKLQGTGLLAANDISPSRVKALQKNLENFGVTNALVLSEDPKNLVEVFPEYFDKILIDAPCSGEGMFRKKGSMVKYWLEHGPEFYSGIQRNLVLYGADMLRPGGFLLYSTCTFSPMEDEETLVWLLEQRPQMHLVSLKEFPGCDHGHPEWTSGGGPEELRRAIRFGPHKIRGEGHFVALLQKSGDEEGDRLATDSTGDPVPQEAWEFLKEIAWEWDRSRFAVKNGNLYYRPKGTPPLHKLRVSREGLFLGILKKNRFEPVQALAMALKKEEYPRTVCLDAGDPRTVKYLKGESIEAETEQKGWYLVCAGRYPLGWAKSDGSRLKNKYNPNWRMM